MGKAIRAIERMREAGQLKGRPRVPLRKLGPYPPQMGEQRPARMLQRLGAGLPQQSGGLTYRFIHGAAA